MKRFWMACWSVGLVCVILSTGCNVGLLTAHTANAGKMVMMSQGLGPTLTQSAGEHLHVINATIDMDRRALFEDLDILYQTDRPTRLTRWIER